MSIILKFFQKITEGGTLPDLFFVMQVTYQNKTNITQKKKIAPMSLKSIDAKIVNKILANRIQQHIKRIIHHDQVGFIPGMQRFFNICKLINVIHHINKLKDKTYDNLNRCRKSFWQNLMAIYEKTLQQMGIEGTYLT